MVKPDHCRKVQHSRIHTDLYIGLKGGGSCYPYSISITNDGLISQ